MNQIDIGDKEINNRRYFCEECHLCKAKKLPHKEKPQELIDEEKRVGIRKGVIHSKLLGPLRNKSLTLLQRECFWVF